MNKWFDNNGLMSPFGENGILFRAEFDELEFKTSKKINPFAAEATLRYQFYGDHWKDSPTSQEKWSHDNHKAMICISKRNGFKYHKSVYWKDFHKMIHPKDLILFTWATGKWYSWIALLGLWFTSLNMVLTCVQDEKIRPGIWSRIKDGAVFGKIISSYIEGNITYSEYENIFTKKRYILRRMLKTDGKLLAWLLLSTFNMPITKFFCNLAIKHNPQFGSWEKCFEIYFKDSEHPNNNFPKDSYKL